VELLHCFVTAHGAACVQQCLHDAGAILKPLVQQERFGRTANPCTSQFGVEHNVLRHLCIGACMNVYVTVPFPMADDGNASFTLHTLHQALSAARHDDVDVL